MNEVAKNPPIRKRDRGLSRMRKVEAATTALLVIDVQNGTFNAAQEAIRPEFFVTARDVVIPNLTKLIVGCR
jgi:hypothetical protein